MSRLVPALLLLLAACLPVAAPPARERISTPQARDFFDFPEKFRGRTVRLLNLTVERADPTRPARLLAEDAGRASLVVTDGRGLIGRQGVAAGDRVGVVIECTEGRAERGNLLLAIDPWPPRGAPGTARP